ncbi:MAG TPA: ABC transporter substrate-binding protein [Myxococcaceae bacterium]|nr:ABC transporter substrate-binding protein [Myxococcaceae bacterium]
MAEIIAETLGTDLAGRYRFIGEIGRGGMANVYLTATRGALGGFQKLVVIKLLRTELAEEPEFRQMFLAEARLAARLNHPHVVQTYDVGEDDGRYYLAMEYVEGQTLETVRRALDAPRFFTLRMQLQILVHVLAGLHYAHELADYDGKPLNVVHRDVTPSNILLGYDGRVKLVDFGVAKALDSGTQTRAGVVKGKTGYMAPEAFTDSGHVDRRADIYSVGVLLWEALVGRRMWKHLGSTDRLQRAIEGEVEPLRALVPEVPQKLEQICMKALQLRPEHRYATAAELQADLEAYLERNPPRVSEREIGHALATAFAGDRKQITTVIEHQLKNDAEVKTLPDLSPQTSKLVTGVGQTASRFTLGATQRPKSKASPSGMPLKVGVVVLALALGAGMAWLLRSGEGRPLAPGTAGKASAAASPGSPAPAPNRVRGVSDSEILMGMSAAFSGPAQELGNRMKLGIETGFAQINDGGGVNGRRLRLVALDDGYEGSRALDNMAELLDQRSVFAVIGNVGTPTAQQTVPYAVKNRTLFFGAFTGSALLRKDPPDRYVFNYRASYQDETARMIHYLLNVKRIDPQSIVVFAQHDTYGDAGYDGASKGLRKEGRTDVDLLRVNYERNTVDVDAAVRAVLKYDATEITTRGPKGQEFVRRRHPVRAIIMVSTYKAATRFIQKVKDAGIDAVFLNVSFVGSNALAEGLKELGPTYANGVIVTQVVPHYDSGSTGVIRFREALKKYHPDQHPDFISLEGFVASQLFAEGVRRAGRELDTEKLVDALESIHDYDLGVGTVMSFGLSEHQASHKVWGTMIDAQGQFRTLDME